MEPQRQLRIELPPDNADGVYSNVVFIVHSPSEFVFDFGRMVPGREQAKIHARIITTPRNAKGFQKALEQNIKKFEEQFGPIKLEGEDDRAIGFRSGDKAEP